MGVDDEIERRKALVAAQETDLDRWSQRGSFMPRWALRASMAADFIPAYSKILDIGAGAMDLERVLPEGCEYQPCDLVRRDERTLVCDLNRGEFPQGVQVDIVTMLGVLEYIKDPLDLLLKVRQLNTPLVCSYSIIEKSPDLDRASQGWINNLDFSALDALMEAAGFRLESRQDVDPLQDIFKWVPADPSRQNVSIGAPKKVLVLSYYNDPNFGDRLGYHLINGLIPADALVTHASVKPWTVPDEPFDLLILGIGNSLNSATVARPELHRLIETMPHTLGVFGTQYRSQYRDAIDPKLIDSLLSNITTWWARYEEDIQAFGRGRDNVRHLGDVLISAFPNTTPTLDRTLIIPAEIKDQDVSLDRIIQQIQRYRRVSTARIHPMLCALTSAEEISYQEQHEDPNNAVSGKFRSQLYDIFGRTFEENKFFKVDRGAVVRYKVMVEANMKELQAQIRRLLA